MADGPVVCSNGYISPYIVIFNFTKSSKLEKNLAMDRLCFAGLALDGLSQEGLHSRDHHRLHSRIGCDVLEQSVRSLDLIQREVG